jgi:hypothetical protein
MYLTQRTLENELGFVLYSDVISRSPDSLVPLWEIHNFVSRREVQCFALRGLVSVILAGGLT